MNLSLAQPYQYLLAMLAAFSTSFRASQPSGSAGARWSRAAVHLEDELRSLTAEPDHEALKSSALRLTQLARTMDGIRLEHSADAPATRLLDERRLVVFAAWQLLQTLEHDAALAPAGSPG